MAKVVKDKKDGLRAGTAGNTKSLSAVDSKSVTAVKDGNTRVFSRLTWDFLPPDKNGWALSSETPKDVKTVKIQTSANELSDDEKALLEARTEYKNVFGEGAEDNLTVDELNDAVSAKIQGDQDELLKGLTEKVLTQDDLDLNPEWAKAGKKVGETIHVNAEGILNETVKPVETPQSETPKTPAKAPVAKAEKVAKPKTARKVVVKKPEGGK